MSVDQGILSPPSSGRMHKTDPPRIGNLKGITGLDMFGSKSGPLGTSSGICARTMASVFLTSGSSINNEQSGLDVAHPHPASFSPIKKKLSDNDDGTRPPTPPMSRDVRHEDGEGEAQHSTEPSLSDGELQVERQMAVRLAPAAVIRSHTYPPTTSSQAQVTRNQAFVSDDDQNPFLERSSTSTRSSIAPSHHVHPYYDELDSEQDAEGSADEIDLLDSSYDEPTPRASGSQLRLHSDQRGEYYYPARPFSERVSVANTDVTTTLPIRDTPKNPFLAGGPADHGFHGPRATQAYARARQIPGKERGKITYVFRGQRVTYADPEYDSDDSEDGYVDGPRPPRLQPKLLFPPEPRSRVAGEPTRSSYSSPSSSSASFTHTSQNRSGLGGGLFAEHLAAKRKRDHKQQEEEHNARFDPHFDHKAAPTTCMRLQAATSMRSSGSTLAAACPKQQEAEKRNAALLARLDQTDWSDDEEHEASAGNGLLQGGERPAKRLRSSLLDSDDDDDCDSNAEEDLYGARSHGQPTTSSSQDDEREAAFWLDNDAGTRSRNHLSGQFGQIRAAHPPQQHRTGLVGRMRGREDDTSWSRR